ncbi:DUF2865 domain-containing protein [Nitratireductor rhodophyticola]|uniref:DUF2865 domain-containing protein n=2 Tax=Nitratireductor rhodophyticola TaxID=2854036 RepID=UPI003BA85D58
MNGVKKMYLRGNDLLRFLLLANVCLVVVAATLANAEAKSRTCRNLESQLAATSSGSSGLARRYDRAIAKQMRELGVVRARIKSSRCGFGIFGKNPPQCAQLKASATHMSRNLAKLRKERALKGGGSPSQRSQLQAALRANNCKEKTASRSHRAKKTRKGTASKKRVQHRPGTVYQTMCVRTCDGYYFPISFSVAKDKFTRDVETCEARCPGAEVALYAHNVLTEEAEDMVSVADGVPYRELPTAFSYRRTGLPGTTCRCRKDRRFTIVAGQKAVDVRTGMTDGAAQASETPKITKATSSQKTSSFHIVIPREQATPGDEDSAAQLRGNAPRSTPSENEAAQRRVRIVGPAFLPDPEEAIDLRAPAPAPAP